MYNMNAPFPIIEIIKFNYVKVANQLTYSDDSYRVFVTTYSNHLFNSRHVYFINFSK